MTNTAALPHLSEDSTVHLYDAQGDLSPARLALFRQQFAQDGALHITNTGLGRTAHILPLLAELGFGEDAQFTAGGRTAQNWQDKWAAPGLRNMDYYPAHFYLLPNGEVNYRRDFPARVLFFCNLAPMAGGRTFLHSAKKLEQAVLAQGTTGAALLQKLAAHGLMIETGFLDESHPVKKQNYHQSWQERFGTKDKAAALTEAQAQGDEYDTCWWVEDEGHPVLMTRITLQAFVSRNGERYMRFPRIAADAPAPRNGFRRFPLGDGTELTDAEKALLKDAYVSTQEGFAWKTGDIILMDNIRYAHSREPYTGPREVLLGMAGLERI